MPFFSIFLYNRRDVLTSEYIRKKRIQMICIICEWNPKKKEINKGKIASFFNSKFFKKNIY